MGTSILQSLREVWRAFGYSLISLQLLIWGAFVVVELLLLGAVPFSVTPFGGFLYGAVVIYTVLALGLVVSPFIWGAIGTTATIVAQPGGEEGLSAADAVDKIGTWGKASLERMLVWLIFWPPLYLIFLAIGGAKGMVLGNILFVLLLPTFLVFVRFEFPVGRLALRVVGWGMMLVIIAMFLYGGFNIVSRTVSDPVAQAIEEDAQKTDEEFTQATLSVYRRLQAARKAGETLSPADQNRWEAIQRVYGKQSGNQTLATASAAATQAGKFAGEVANEVIDPNRPVSSKSWWLIAAAVAVIVLLTILIARRRPATVGATSTGAVSQTAKRSWLFKALIWEILTLAVGIWLYVLWISGPGYAEKAFLKIDDRQRQVLYYPTFPKGTRLMFVLPGEEHGQAKGEILVGVHGEDGKGHVTNLASDLLIGDGVGRMVKKGQPFIPTTKTELHARFDIRSGQDIRLDTPVTVPIMVIRYYDDGIMRWIMSQYY